MLPGCCPSVTTCHGLPIIGMQWQLVTHQNLGKKWPVMSKILCLGSQKYTCHKIAPNDLQWPGPTPLKVIEIHNYIMLIQIHMAVWTLLFSMYLQVIKLAIYQIHVYMAKFKEQLQGSQMQFTERAASISMAVVAISNFLKLIFILELYAFQILNSFRIQDVAAAVVLFSELTLWVFLSALLESFHPLNLYSDTIKDHEVVSQYFNDYFSLYIVGTIIMFCSLWPWPRSSQS